MKYLSLFSGIGGFELGIEQAYVDVSTPSRSKQNRMDVEKSKSSNNHKSVGTQQSLTCVGYSETDKYAIHIYEQHFSHKNYGDITKLIPRELPKFELLVGGFPCQAFSIAGKRRGFDDTRGTLFFDIARILKEKQPRLLLLENVKGLLSHDDGNTFKTIITTLDELGYDLQWQVLNSKNFGVPQNRERVFIIGHLRGTPRPQVFPIGESNQGANETNQKGKFQQESVTSALKARDYKDGTTFIDETPIVPTIRATEHKRGDNQTVVVEDFYPDRIRTFKESPTLRGDRQGLKVKQNVQIRRLTPIKAERLQGFPGGWTEGISDTQRYKTLGNAVTTNVVQEIMKKLLNEPKI